MLSKCLWKMFTRKDSAGNDRRVELDDLLDSLIEAIDTLPQRKDSRSEPIFEPHSKLVSIVHKLIRRGDLSVMPFPFPFSSPFQCLTNLKLAEGSEALLATPWARKMQTPENMESWDSYVLEILRRLKSADKAHWHHRIPARVRRSFVCIYYVTH